MFVPAILCGPREDLPTLSHSLDLGLIVRQDPAKTGQLRF
jgi:hypothetical protein